MLAPEVVRLENEKEKLKAIINSDKNLLQEVLSQALVTRKVIEEKITQAKGICKRV